MYEFSNVLDASYGAYVVSGARSGQSKSASGRDHNDVVATIREFVNGETAVDELTLKEALETNTDTMSRIIENSSDAYKTQANVEPSIVLQLLKDGD